MRLTDDQTQLQDSARKLMRRHAPPDVVRELDERRLYPYDLHRAWAEAGLLALAFPEEDGGLGGSVADLLIVGEEISYASPDLFMAFAGNVFCGLNIARKGSPAQRRAWLPKLMAGELRMAISMSEPGAGSDVGAIQTHAVRDGAGWRINGQKLWCTGAGADNTLLNIYLRTDREAPYRKGLSLMLVENDAEGVELRRCDMLGRRATGTYEVFLKDVYVDDSRIIGGLNQGWDCAMSGLQIERDRFLREQYGRVARGG
ncbi:MAG: acyl-CoA/acyl-ACP dehydrogenase [Terricaulis sp.]|nr:acyl-CoA/acyl-ACP dehydrogenase [Terricaulis sp.]